MVDPSLLNYVLPLALGFYSIAFSIYSIIAIRGPTVPDMVLALDVMTVDLIVIYLLIALFYQSPILAIGAIPLAAWVFLLDMVVSKYLLEARKK
ncbi:monovalent cation/H+ antiporter complex subunit F [Thermogladius sp. 4427co]|uniref:monovalent cation/H+ antiporter complex subunit F n=1 Tax=Thermogladius sp. 4427co TaxID=3450718 RepID=UPI003F793670